MGELYAILLFVFSFIVSTNDYSHSRDNSGEQ